MIEDYSEKYYPIRTYWQMKATIAFFMPSTANKGVKKRRASITDLSLNNDGEKLHENWQVIIFQLYCIRGQGRLARRQGLKTPGAAASLVHARCTNRCLHSLPTDCCCSVPGQCTPRSQIPLRSTWALLLQCLLSLHNMPINVYALLRLCHLALPPGPIGAWTL